MRSDFRINWEGPYLINEEFNTDNLEKRCQVKRGIYMFHTGRTQSDKGKVLYLGMAAKQKPSVRISQHRWDQIGKKIKQHYFKRNSRRKIYVRVGSIEIINPAYKRVTNKILYDIESVLTAKLKPTYSKQKKKSFTFHLGREMILRNLGKKSSLVPAKIHFTVTEKGNVRFLV